MQAYFRRDCGWLRWDFGFGKFRRVFGFGLCKEANQLTTGFGLPLDIG